MRVLDLWSYTDAVDLGDAIGLACVADVVGHEVVFVAQPDNAVGQPLEDLVRRAFPDADIELRELPRPDASGLDSSKAQRLVGWTPTASWRDHLDATGSPVGSTMPPD